MLTVSKKEKKQSKHTVQDMVRAKKNKPCTDCKHSFPYYVMDLDYTGPRDRFSLSNAVRHANPKNLAFILKELELSEPVCSNCHRIRDHLRGTRGKSED